MFQPPPANDALVLPPRDVQARPRAFTPKQTHYCPGCTHGVAHRVVAELIDELGRVESAAIRSSVHPSYDAMLLAAAADWRFSVVASFVLRRRRLQYRHAAYRAQAGHDRAAPVAPPLGAREDRSHHYP